jgi:prolipoprotein diacylglyceryltransferase
LIVELAETFVLYQELVVILTFVAIITLASAVHVNRRLVVEGALVTTLGVVLLSKPLYLGALWLSGENSTILQRSWKAGGLLGSAALASILVGMIVGIVWSLIRGKKQFYNLAALGTLALSFAYGIGKWGCLGYGCCYGKRTFGWWAVQFSSSTIVSTKLGPGHFVHPVQLYDSLASLSIFAVLLFLLRRLSPKVVTCIGLISLALMRVALEQFRYQQSEDLLGVPYLSINVVMALLAVTVCAWILYKGRREPKTSKQLNGL